MPPVKQMPSSRYATPGLYGWTYATLVLSLYIAFSSSETDALSFGGWFAFSVLYALSLYVGSMWERTRRDTGTVVTHLLAVWAVFVMFGAIIATSIPGAGLLQFLVWLQFARNFSLYEKRDFIFTIAVAVSMVVFGSSFVTVNANVIPLFFFLFALIATLFIVHDRDFHCAQSSPGVAAPAVPMGTCLLVALLMLGVGFLIFLVCPQPPGSGFGNNLGLTNSPDPSGQLSPEIGVGSGEQPSEQANQIPGCASRDAIRMDGIAGAENRRLVLYVEAPGRFRARLRTYNRFDGATWHATQSDTAQLANEYSGFFGYGLDLPEIPYYEVTDSSLGASAVTNGVRFPQAYYAAASGWVEIPAAYRVNDIHIAAALIVRHEDLTFTTTAPLRRGDQWRATSLIPDLDHWWSPSLLVPGANEHWVRYLEVPPEIRADLQEVVTLWTAEAGDSYSAALALQYALEDNCTLRADSGAATIPDFLFGSRTGTEQMFAGTMVLLLRQAGIPARLVAGYRVKTRDPFLSIFEVRASDAGVWAEGFFADAGWLAFDPSESAFTAGARGTAPPLFDFLDFLHEHLLDLAVNAAWDKPLSLLAYLIIAIWDFLANILHLVMTFFLVAWRMLVAHLLAALIILLGLAAVAGSIWRFVLPWWRRRRVRPLADDEARDFAVHAFLRLCRLLARAGIRRAPSTTATGIVSAAADLPAEDQVAVKTVVGAFNRARYGGVRLEAHECATVLDALERLARHPAAHSPRTS